MFFDNTEEYWQGLYQQADSYVENNKEEWFENQPEFWWESQPGVCLDCGCIGADLYACDCERLSGPDYGVWR